MLVTLAIRGRGAGWAARLARLLAQHGRMAWTAAGKLIAAAAQALGLRYVQDGPERSGQ